MENNKTTNVRAICQRYSTFTSPIDMFYHIFNDIDVSCGIALYNPVYAEENDDAFLICHHTGVEKTLLIKVTLKDGNTLCSIKDAFDKQMEKLGYKQGENINYTFKNAQGDAGKAAEQLMNQKYGLGKWRKGARTEYNALKKWLDRIIRGRI